MKIQILVTIDAEPIGEAWSAEAIVTESAKMAVLDALTEQEANGFVHPLNNLYSLHVASVEAQ